MLNILGSSFIDKKLEDLSTAEAMRDNGWIITCTSKVTGDQYADSCGDTTWFGYNYQGDCTASATFAGAGHATLVFANCRELGDTIVYLNDTEISRSKRPAKKEVSFEYFKGDKLVIKEESHAIIQLHSLTLRAKGESTV